MGTRYLAIGKETSWGTMVAPTARMEMESETLQLEKSISQVTTIRSKSVREQVVDYRIVRGDLTVPANYQEMGEFLYYLFGSVDTGAGPPYAHTFPASTGLGDRIPFTAMIQRDSAALTWRYSGCMMTGWSLEQGDTGVATCTYTILGKNGYMIPEVTGAHTAADDPVVMTDATAVFEADALVALTGTNVTDDSSGTITANTTTTFTVDDLTTGSDDTWQAADVWTVTWAEPAYRDLDLIKRSHWTVNFGAGAFCATSISLNVSWPLDETICLGSTTLSREPQDSDVMTVSGTISAIFEDYGEYQYFGQGDTTTMDVTLTATNATETVVFNINKATLEQATPHVDGRGRLTVDYAFLSQFDATATESMQVVLTNLHDDVTD